MRIKVFIDGRFQPVDADARDVLRDRIAGGEGGGFGAARVYETGGVIRFADDKVVGVRVGAAAAKDGDDLVLGEGRAVASQGQVLPRFFEIIDDLLDGFPPCVREIGVVHFSGVAAQQHGAAGRRDDSHTLGVAAAGQVVGRLHEGGRELVRMLSVQDDMGAETRDDAEFLFRDHVVDDVGVSAGAVDDHAGGEGDRAGSAFRLSVRRSSAGDVHGL